MHMEILKKIYFLAVLLFIFSWLSSAFILPYSAYLCRKVREKQPEFFDEKNLCQYMTNRNRTQFIFYIVFNYHKKIKDPIIKRKCQLLRNFTYIVIFSIIFACLVIMIGNAIFP